MEYKMNQHGQFLTGREEGRSAYKEMLKKAKDLEEYSELILSFEEVKMMNPSFCDSSIGNLLLDIKTGDLSDKNIEIAFSQIESATVDSTLQTVADCIGFPDVKIIA
jgi:hypothetical protein